MKDWSDTLLRRFVSALVVLNNCGKVRWSRAAQEPEFIFGAIGDDLIRFELSQGVQDFDPTKPVGGIVANVRNCHLLWLESLGGWDELVALLLSIPVDATHFAEMLRSTEEQVVRRLEELAAG